MWSRESVVRRVLAAVAIAVLVLALPGSALGAGPVAQVPGAAPAVATIVDIRAAHHPGYDRFVLEFDTRTAPQATVAFVPALIGDFSGQRVPVPGRAVIRVQVQGAQAHTRGRRVHGHARPGLRPAQRDVAARCR